MRHLRYLAASSTNLKVWEVVGEAMDRGDGAFEFVGSPDFTAPCRFYVVVTAH